MHYEDALRALETAAGWHLRRVDDEGSAAYELEGGRIVRLAALGANALVVFIELGPCPTQEFELEQLGALAAAAMRAERSVLSVRRGRLELARIIDLSEAQDADVAGATAALLNDADRWAARLETQSAQASPLALGAFSISEWRVGDISI